MKRFETIRKIFGRAALISIIGIAAASCSYDGSILEQEELTSQLDFCVEKNGYAMSRAAAGLFEEPESANAHDEQLGVWLRKSESPLAWLTENERVNLAGGAWSSIACDAYQSGTELEVFAYAPYSTETTIIAEAFQNRATNSNIAGVYYKISSESSDLSVGATTTTSDNIAMRLTPVLTKVGFTVSVNIDGQARMLTIGEAGQFDLGDGNRIIINSVTLNGNFYGEGVVNMLSCNWAVPDATNSYFEGTNYIGSGEVNADRINELTLTGKDFVSAEDFDTASSTSFRLNTTESFIHLIPQSCADGDAVSFAVNYTIINPSDCALTFTETSAPQELAFHAGETKLFDIAFNFSTIGFNPTVVAWK